jgi:fructose/tagatose bisphosphate aldolase
MVITDRRRAEKIMEICAQNKVAMAVFCTGGYWNTEAILLAAKRFAEKHGIETLPVTVAMTFNYPYMPQARRINYAGAANEGLMSCLTHLNALCSDGASSYARIAALPHLDHADPKRDGWGLTKAVPHLASVLFDAQAYAYGDNVAMTSEYVKEYGRDVMVEGIIEQLTVEGMHEGKKTDDYVTKAADYIKKTGVDFLVADLGTEQQSGAVGKCRYLSGRARELTAALGRPMLVLHGTSCLNDGQMNTLADDGVLRVNMWTRIVREAGQYAAKRLAERYPDVEKGVFEACEGRQYLYDMTEKAAEIMEHTLKVLGYANLSGIRV